MNENTAFMILLFDYRSEVPILFLVLPNFYEGAISLSEIYLAS